MNQNQSIFQRGKPMKPELCVGVLVLSLAAVVSAHAGIIKGVMSVTGAEMD